MRGSHHAPLMPVSVADAHPSRFDGPPRVVGLGFQITDGRLIGPRDMLTNPSFDRARTLSNEVMDYLRRHGPFEPHRLPRDEMVLFTSRGEAARGLWCDGAPRLGLRPWADPVVADVRALPAIARRVGPGGSIMVAYGVGQTEAALRRRVPPAATPLGRALIAAGCRWLKDWYFAEGGREGATKLQGTLPRPTPTHGTARRAA